jgi:hypothetical protein
MCNAPVTYSQKNQITPALKKFLTDLAENDEAFNNTLKERFDIPSEIDLSDFKVNNTNKTIANKIAPFSGAKSAVEKNTLVSSIKKYLEFKKGFFEQINSLEKDLRRNQAAHPLPERQGANLFLNSEGFYKLVKTNIKKTLLTLLHPLQMGLPRLTIPKPLV